MTQLQEDGPVVEPTASPVSTSPAAAMATSSVQIDRIESLADLDRLKAGWDAVYAADAKAHLFVSWWWLRGWLEVAPQRWFVLAVRSAPTGPYVAFLPLALVTHRRMRINLVRILRMASKPFGDYSGFVCRPEFELSAIAALGRYVQDKVEWDRFTLEHVVDDRLDAFLNTFDTQRCHVRQQDPVPCPRICLPPSWEAYLAEFLSSDGRYKVKQRIQKIETLPGFRTTTHLDGDFDGQIDALLNLWQARWGAKSAELLDIHRHVFRQALKHDGLWLRIHWVGPTAIAASLAYHDRVRRCFAHFIGSYDNDYRKLAPGQVSVSCCVRDAIDNGATFFDFLLGGEQYKMESFGAVPRTARSVIITHRSLRSRIGRKLERLSATPCPTTSD